MLHLEKAALRQEMRLNLYKIADAVEEKSLLIRNRLMTIDAFQYALQSQRLMSFVSMLPEVNTTPFFDEYSMIVPFCESGEIVPIRILSLGELEPAGNMKILEPRLAFRQDISRQILPEQIAVVLVPGLAFDRLGNRLGRGKGFYDRFLRRLPCHVLSIGLTFDETLRDQIPHDENDCPVKMVVSESAVYESGSCKSGT